MPRDPTARRERRTAPTLPDIPSAKPGNPSGKRTPAEQSGTRARKRRRDNIVEEVVTEQARRDPRREG
jgi:hypothetical protein